MKRITLTGLGFVALSYLVGGEATTLPFSDVRANVAESDSIVADTFYLGYTHFDNGYRFPRRTIVIDDSQRVHVVWGYQPLPLYGYSQGPDPPPVS